MNWEQLLVNTADVGRTVMELNCWNVASWHGGEVELWVHYGSYFRHNRGIWADFKICAIAIKCDS